ncbi:MAG: type IX secretion system sortase PorU, partial [Bacteroidales bacterium]|nr:type IX secretion system sortase PorU [Bacteroidales bacterium]
MNRIFYFFVIFFCSWSITGFGQSHLLEGTLNWKGLFSENNEHGSREYLYFEDAFADAATNLPLYTVSFPISSKNVSLEANFENAEFEPFDQEEKQYLVNSGFSADSIEITTSVSISRKIPSGVVNFIPIRWNKTKGQFEKLVSFSINVTTKYNPDLSKSSRRVYAENSVLSSGEWYKIKVGESGIYKISYSDLQSYGLDPASIDPRDIRIYGNSDGMLPEANISFRHDDLQENAIEVTGEDDGNFDPDDYIVFYGKSSHIWHDVLGFFTYIINYYENFNYYYLTTSLGPGKRLETESSSTSTPSHYISTFNDYRVIEDDVINLISSGKEWYGDEFGEINSRNYEFEFPNINTEEDVVIKMEIANRTFINEFMAVNVNNDTYDTVVLTSVNPNSVKYARKKKKTVVFSATGPEININLDYHPSSTSSKAWLDYIMVNAISNITLTDGQLLFRDLSSLLEGAVTRFTVENANGNTQIWDVTDPLNTRIIESEITEDQLIITVRTDSLREFIAFDRSRFLSPEFVGSVENQNLHGEGPFDYVIVVHPLFENAAYQLAGIHDSINDFLIKVTSPEEIYNEFSSSKQDPTAIRDYMKMLYDKYEGQEPRFLTLFGDGSFDPKDRHENNSNYIPTFQTKESWNSATSYVIDDYFGYLDDDEGNDAIGVLDIGIGRLPVQTSEEAQIAIDKIIRYLTKGEPYFGQWRTRTCMIADDEDGNLHLDQADSLCKLIPDYYNQNKIYLDSYHQISTPNGHRYPDVTKAINKQMEEGVLIMNYVGHGGKSGWAHERILQTSDIQGWQNEIKLPLFITATCEFSRFDEPELNTGGEMVLLNPNGGGIALLTTTRLAYSQSNFSLNLRVYNNAFNRVDGEMPYLGDLIRLSKPPGQLTTRNFVLLGDPALKLAYPEYEVNTLEVNGNGITSITDTLNALEKITVSGEINNYDGNLIQSFNGMLYATVYDKPSLYNTIGNDANSPPTTFQCQDKIIWHGKATVSNGGFTFSFMVPRDIALNFGKGKISYYAISDNTDAFGYFDNFVIGGINENAEPDTQGPEIELYLNDLSFISGDQTHESP